VAEIFLQNDEITEFKPLKVLHTIPQGSYVASRDVMALLDGIAINPTRRIFKILATTSSSKIMQI
jgi:hypothetical protein